VAATANDLRIPSGWMPSSLANDSPMRRTAALHRSPLSYCLPCIRRRGTRWEVSPVFQAAVAPGGSSVSITTVDLSFVDHDRNDFFLEFSGTDGFTGALVTAQCPSVGIFTGNSLGLRRLFRPGHHGIEFTNRFIGCDMTRRVEFCQIRGGPTPTTPRVPWHESPLGIALPTHAGFHEFTGM